MVWASRGRNVASRKGHSVGEETLQAGTGSAPSASESAVAADTRTARARASLPLQAASAFRRALAAHGVRGFLSQIPHYFSEVAFDLRYGVRTSGQLLMDGGADYEFDYDPIEPRRFRDAFRAFGIPTNQTFVDFGCGKGRPLILAGNYGFPRVRGVEIVPEWCADAERNLSRWQRRSGRSCDVEVVLSDARTYEIRPDETVFFFFNPFPADVLRAVVTNIENSLEQQPRNAWVVYANPLHRHSVFSDARWELAGELSGADHHSFVLYRPRGNERAVAPEREPVFAR